MSVLWVNLSWLILSQMLLADNEAESELLGVPIPKRDYYSENIHYGAPFIAAEYCGLDGPPKNTIRGEWAHGWHPPEHNIHPELVVGSDGLSRLRCRNKIFWMARKDQVEYLNFLGYRRVSAIGMPLIYLPKIIVEREKGSMLVMPVHSLSTTSHDFNFEKYVDQINQIRNRFSRIVACVYPECIAKDYWVPHFVARGIPIISGASINDKNSLLRMAVLFSRFEFVTTNGFGSHLAYSAFFGAKPSIFGDLVKYKKKDFQNDLIYVNCPELLPLVIKMSSESYLKKVYGRFFRNPWDADTKQEWAQFQLGFQHKHDPQRLRKVFFNFKKRTRIFIKEIMQKINVKRS